MQSPFYVIFFIWFGIGEGSSSFITPDCTAFWIQSTRWYLPNRNTSRWGRKWNCVSNQKRIRSGADKISCWDTGFQLWIYCVSVLGSLICITSCNMGESLTKTRKQKDRYAQKGLVWCKAVREMWRESRPSLAQRRAPADPLAEHGAASAAPGWKEARAAAAWCWVPPFSRHRTDRPGGISPLGSVWEQRRENQAGQCCHLWGRLLPSSRSSWERSVAPVPLLAEGKAARPLSGLRAGECPLGARVL